MRKTIAIIVQAVIILVMGVGLFLMNNELSNAQEALDNCDSAFEHQKGVMIGVLHAAKVENFQRLRCEEHLQICATILADFEEI